MFHKTLAYVERFNRFENDEAVREVRNWLEEKGFQQHEVAALTTLIPEEAAEARTLIPTLSRFEQDDELQEVLEKVLRFTNL